MREYASWHTAKLLRKVTAEARKTARAAEKDAIHDLRVSIRRLRACLRLFAQFYPGEERRKLNQEVKALMHAAGDVRDRDIALELLAEAGVSPAAAAVRRLQEQRRESAARLHDALKGWKARGVARQWRRRLEV